MNSIFSNLVNVPQPRQARSQEALVRLLRAGEKLLVDNRFEQASVADIVREANSSVGTFYRLLGDKDTLWLLLLQGFFVRIESALDDEFQPEKWKASSLEDVALAFVRSFTGIYAGRAGVLRAMILRSSRDAEFRDKVMLVLYRRTNESISLLLQPHKARVNHPRPDQVIDSVAHMILSILSEHTVMNCLGELSQSQLVDELYRLFLAYLCITAPSDAHS